MYIIKLFFNLTLHLCNYIIQRHACMDKSHRKKSHALVITYPLQGHIIPSVHLATKLASNGFTVTFVNTESIHHQTSKAQNNNNNNNIFAGVRNSGLDINYEIISDGLPISFDRSLNHDQFMASLLHVISAHVEELVKKLMSSDDPVTCIIADTFFVWPSTISKKFGIPYISFWTEPALVFSLYYHMHLLRLHGHLGSCGNYYNPCLFFLILCFTIRVFCFKFLFATSEFCKFFNFLIIVNNFKWR